MNRNKGSGRSKEYLVEVTALEHGLASGTDIEKQTIMDKIGLLWSSETEQWESS